MASGGAPCWCREGLAIATRGRRAAGLAPHVPVAARSSCIGRNHVGERIRIKLGVLLQEGHFVTNAELLNNVPWELQAIDPRAVRRSVLNCQNPRGSCQGRCLFGLHLQGRMCLGDMRPSEHNVAVLFASNDKASPLIIDADCLGASRVIGSVLALEHVSLRRLGRPQLPDNVLVSAKHAPHRMCIIDIFIDTKERVEQVPLRQRLKASLRSSSHGVARKDVHHRRVLTS
mmetsp:Transcript_45496/g.85357  ORF Transcript_45496/g.85357 Transcript_45496/m.85357 type:complete len:230 (+) Transcript_45496:433-1122(+)